MHGIVDYVLEGLQGAADREVLFGNRRCQRPIWTCSELETAIEETAAGLVAQGLKKGDRVALIADNCDSWLIFDLACLSIGVVSVPRAADTGRDEVCFVAKHSQCEYLVLEEEDLIATLWEPDDQLHHLKGPWLLKANADSPHPSLESMRAQGRELLAQDSKCIQNLRASITPNDLATIVYTSGTTGNPKGVMLKHGNIMHNVATLPDMVNFRGQDRYLSFLPTWHAFERTLEYCLLSRATPIYYSSKATVRKDMARVRPTVMAGVPRLWESIVSGVLAKVEKMPTALRATIRTFLAASEKRFRCQNLLRGGLMDERNRICRPSVMTRGWAVFTSLALSPLHALADKLVYSKIRAAMGNEVRFLVSGGGALPDHVDEFINRAGVQLLNGYGLTETSPVVCLRDFEQNVLGSSGRRLPETQWRVMNEAGTEVLAQGEKGVLWIHGPQVMSGYFANEEATSKVLIDGWFCSGDLAVLSDEDDVVICGRAKDTLVLRGGENVEPENIEARLMQSPHIADVVVVGHGQKHLGALILPNPETLVEKFPSLDADNIQQAAESAEVGAFLHREISQLLSADAGYRVFERVPRIALIAKPFEVDDGTLTATLKKRRAPIEALYAEEIAAMFSSEATEFRVYKA